MEGREGKKGGKRERERETTRPFFRLQASPSRVQIFRCSVSSHFSLSLDIEPTKSIERNCPQKKCTRIYPPRPPLPSSACSNPPTPPTQSPFPFLPSPIHPSSLPSGKRNEFRTHQPLSLHQPQSFPTTPSTPFSSFYARRRACFVELGRRKLEQWTFGVVRSSFAGDRDRLFVVL